MDWQMLTMVWAPVTLIVAALWKVHRDVVYKLIPEQFKRTRRLMFNQSEEARIRHMEFLTTVKALITVLDNHTNGKKAVQIAPSRPADRLKRGKTHRKKAPRKRGG